jgi:hypothetical protein
MGFRKTGIFRDPEEIVVLTCDVCERDIGNADGRRPKDHFELSRHPNPGGLGGQVPSVIVCSCECLRAFAATAPGPSRVPHFSDRDSPTDHSTK